MFSFKTYSFDKNNIKIDNVDFGRNLCFVTSKIPKDDDSEIVKFVKASAYFHCKANNIDVNESDIEFEYWSKHYEHEHRSYNIHLDKDESLFENNSLKMHKELIEYATNNDVYPILTICSYFDDVDEPIVILNAGSDTLSHKLQKYDDHNNILLDSPNFPIQPVVAGIFPKKNTQIIFRGGTFLHGCIPFNDDNVVKDRRIVIINIWKRKIMNFQNKPHKFFLDLPQKIFEVMPDNLRLCIYSKNHNEMKKIIENMHETDSIVWTNRLSKSRIWDSQTGFYEQIINCDFSSFNNYYNDRNQNEDIAKNYENHFDDYMVLTEFKLNLCKQTTNDSNLFSKFLTYNQHKENMTFQNLFNIRSFNRDNYYLLLSQPNINFHTNQPFKLKLLSVATDKNHTGFQNFMYSVNKCNISHKILGLDTEWKGGDMENSPGGGYKINLLKKELKTWTNDELRETILLFTDSYDVILLNNQYDILNKYYEALNKYDYANTILFSCEKSCWPDSTLQKDYPNVYNSSYLYLNSGSFIGNAMNIKKLICEYNINDNDDDQLYFTNIFLKHKLYIRCQLDYQCLMFQTLNNSIQDITIKCNHLYNSTTNSLPPIIHGNGPQENKLFLNYIFSCFKDNNNHILYKNISIFKTLYNITPLSIPTFIINMERNIDRKKSMIEKIKDSGLNNFNFVKAIDGKTDLCNHNFKVKDNININIGEIGCFLSHLNIWKYIIDNNIEYALILEDDTIFNTTFNFYMNYIMKNIHLYKSYDLIKINNFRNINNKICLDDIMLTIDHIYNASSYIISKNGAKKIIELKPDENIIPVDDYLSQINECKIINSIATKFNLCDQEYRCKVPSTIIGTKQYNNIESNYKLESFFTKFIHTVSFTVSSKTCSEIIDKLNNTVDYVKQDDSLISCNTVIINENDELWNQNYIDIKKIVKKSFLEYINIFPNAWCPDEVMVIPEIILRKYKKNKGHFNNWHNDYYFDAALKEKLDKLPITTTFLIYLNDVSDGGETEFIQGAKIKPTIGKIILFPAAFPYFHRGVIPKSDDKYIMNGWIIAGQNPDISI